MPLSVDQIRALQGRTTLPPGSVANTFLTWLGPTDDDVNWTSGPDPQVLQGHGNPNSIPVSAPKGTLFINVDAPALWQNTTGLAVWTQVGAGGSSSFPITKDDSTGTGLVDYGSPTFGAGQFAIKNSLDADAVTNMTADSTVAADFAEFRVISNAHHGGDGKIIVDATNTPDTGVVDLIVEDGHSNGAELLLSINNSNTPKSLLKFQAGENLWSGPNAAAATGDLNAGWFSFWFDDTVGACFLNIKAKDSAGTVVTGSIALT